jgi:folate-binding Fe-S cluster repair protein YgfZ
MSEYHQAMLERMQMLEEALERAETGIANREDWDLIRYECGIPRRHKTTLETASIRNEKWL